MTYQENIKALREDRDLSQKTIAKLLHISQNTYSRYECSQCRLPLNT